MMGSILKIKDNRSTYPGGKGASGTHQNIINLIPPHKAYIETHLGGGFVMRQKKPADINIGIDVDPEVISNWVNFLNDSPGHITTEMMIGSMGTASSFLTEGDREYFSIIKSDATRWLKKCKLTDEDFIYADPPYLLGTRKGGELYDYEYTELDHVNLLNQLKKLPCMVMISGYWSSLYEKMLPGWNTHHFEAQTRRGMVTEWLWYNYPKPTKLHDYSYLGDDFRDRERIKKKVNRWTAKLQGLPILERNALLSALSAVPPKTVTRDTWLK